MEEQKKKKKRIWPIFLIAGIVVFIGAIAILLIVLFVVSTIILKKADESRNYNFTYGNLIEDMNMSNKPATVITQNGDPYDYTFINDAITKDANEVKAWITNYYPGSSIQKSKYNGGELWTVTSTNPMNPISVSGVTVNYDQIDFNFLDGYLYKIDFVQNGGDATELDNLYKAFMFKYTYVGPNEDKGNFITKLSDPTYEYTRYWWFERDFDGFYDIILERTVKRSMSIIKVCFEKL